MNNAKEAIRLNLGFGLNPLTGQIDEMANCLEAQRQIDNAITRTQENRS